MGKEDESILFVESDFIRGIGYKMFEFVVDGVEGKHCVFADIGMAVLET